MPAARVVSSMSRLAPSPGVLQHVSPRNPRSTEPSSPAWSQRSARSSTSSFRASRRIHSARSPLDQVRAATNCDVPYLARHHSLGGVLRRCGCFSPCAFFGASSRLQSPQPLPVLPSLPQLSGWTAAPSASMMPDDAVHRQYPFSSQHLGVLFSMLQDMRCAAARIPSLH